MGRRNKRRRAAVVVEEQDGDSTRDRQSVTREPSHRAQKHRKASSDVATAVAAAADLTAAAAAGRQLEPALALDDPRLAPCFGVAMKSLGLERPTPVQSRCWPVCIAGRDTVVIAPTGSGKTLGYILPAVAICLSNDDGEEIKCRPGASPVAVVVCPTRELAQQVHRVCRPFARLYSLQAVCATGGVDKAKQMEELRTVAGALGPPQLLVGTPGRLHDLLGGLSIEDREQQLHEEWEQLQRNRVQHAGRSDHGQMPGDHAIAHSIESVATANGHQPELQAGVARGTTTQLSFAHVRLLVLDEMDKLLSMGNNYELQTIRAACTGSSVDTVQTSSNSRMCDRRKVQVVLFSATLPAVLEEAVAQWVDDPVRISVRSSTTAAGEEAEAAKAAARRTTRALLPPDLAMHADESSAVDGGDTRLPVDGGANRAEVNEGSSTVTECDQGLTEAQEFEQDQNGTALMVASSVTQVVHVCGKVRGEEKQNGARSKARILIFCNRIKTAKFVESMLRKNNHFCKQMSSAMNQTQRERTLNEFRCGKLPILVATDVAGRGLDVRGLEYVVNYDFPSRLEVYVHRVGRTGRQGAGGHSYSFFGRHLSALVPELIGLLEASGQWVDPNLRTLVPRDITRVPAVKKSAARHCGQAQGDSSAEDSDSHSSDGLEQWSDSD